MKQRFTTTLLNAAVAIIATFAITSCDNPGNRSVIGSADGPTEIIVSDENTPEAAIIGGADGPTEIKVSNEKASESECSGCTDSLQQK